MTSQPDLTLCDAAYASYWPETNEDTSVYGIWCAAWAACLASNERKDFAQSSAPTVHLPHPPVPGQCAQLVDRGRYAGYCQNHTAPGSDYCTRHAPPDKGSVSAISTTAESLKADRV